MQLSPLGITPACHTALSALTSHTEVSKSCMGLLNFPWRETLRGSCPFPNFQASAQYPRPQPESPGPAPLVPHPTRTWAPGSSWVTWVPDPRAAALLPPWPGHSPGSAGGPHLASGPFKAALCLRIVLESSAPFASLHTCALRLPSPYSVPAVRRGGSVKHTGFQDLVRTKECEIFQSFSF